MTEKTFTLDTSGVVKRPNATQVPFVWYWLDLSPFAQGYVHEACVAFNALMKTPADKANGWSFSDLAPEALAAMLKDCELAAGRLTKVGADADGNEGRLFWEARQAGRLLPDFPPVTLYLGDDGKIYAREAG